jgi:class 3 adenylate cyclase/tetratricopeptide (TPR) repeat protein
VTSERKVVTVLFADLAGSTRLAAQLDPERFREVMTEFYRTVSDELTSLRGRAEKFVGDAVMAVFGLPQIHEDDAIRAVRAGLIIRDAMARLGKDLRLPAPLQVRIGISSGPVATGSGPADQLLVTGAAVNLAARLQQAAEPNEILVEETTRELTFQSVEFGPAREIPAKGFAQDIRAWPVVALSVRSARRTIPLVGRRRELALLNETFERTRETRRLHLVTILGERGIGKRRLAQEFLSGLPEEATVLTSRASQFEEDVTLAPVAEMIRRELGVDAETPPDQVTKALKEVVAGCCEPSEADLVVARLGLALGLGEEEREGRRYRAAEIRAGFLSFVEAKAQAGPVVLVFDRLHSAQQGLFELIEHIVHNARRIPLMLLCIARDVLLEVHPGWGGGAADALTIRLESLSTEEAVELARVAGESIDEATAKRIAAHAGGNPFFIVETTGMLLQSHEAHLAGAEHVHLLPPTVQAVVAARIDHLPDDAKELVRKASVFPRDTVRVQDLSLIADPKDDVLKILEDEELLVPDPRREGVWRFRHGLLRDVAYESLPKRERQRLHLLVADALDPEKRPQSVAYHVEQAARAALDLDPSDRTLADRAVEALKHAADLARRRIQSRTAIDLYQRALELAGPRDEWGVRESRILAGVGEAHYWLGEYESATSSLSEAMRLGEGDPTTTTHAGRFLADITLNVEGDVRRARPLFERALAAARELADPWPIARTLLMAGWAPYWENDLDAARAMFEEALATARANPEKDQWAEARALTSLASVISPVGDEEECLVLAKEALAIGQDMGDQFTVAVAQSYAGNSLRRMWRLDEAKSPLDQAVRTFRELDARWELASALGDRGNLHRLAERLDAAERDFTEALRICRELRERSLVSWTASRLGMTLLAKGDVEGARRSLEEWQDLPRPTVDEPGSRVSLPEVGLLLSLVEGDEEDAGRRGREMLEIERADGLRNNLAATVWWIGTLLGAEAVGGRKEMDEARRTLEASHWQQALREPFLLLRQVQAAREAAEAERLAVSRYVLHPPG